MGLAAWPTITDDDGSLIVGTVINKAVFDAVRASIEASVYSGTNPSVTGAAIIDEVVNARGSKASVDARLDVALNEDGTLKTAASLVTSTQFAAAIASNNIARNDEMLYWSGGAAVAPDGFSLTGAGAAVAKCGSGLGDTTTLGAGKYCAKITYGAATAKLLQNMLTSTEVSDASLFKGLSITVGVLCKTSTASQASLVVDDGVGTTRGGSTGNGTYHPGDSTVKWLYCTHTLDASATKFDITMEVASAGSAYFGGFFVAFSQVAVTSWKPKTSEPRQPYVRVIEADGATYKQATPADNGATGWSMLLSGGMLKNDGDSLRISIWCDTVGVANAATEIKLVFGTAVVPWRFANDATKVDGMCVVEVIRTGATTQKLSAHGLSHVPSSAGTQCYVAGTETLSGDITISTKHGNSSNATDYVQQVGIRVEYCPVGF